MILPKIFVKIEIKRGRSQEISNMKIIVIIWILELVIQLIYLKKKYEANIFSKIVKRSYTQNS